MLIIMQPQCIKRYNMKEEPEEIEDDKNRNLFSWISTFLMVVFLTYIFIKFLYF